MKQGQLSDNFFRHEFACRCGCSFSTVDAELVRSLENVRDLLGSKPVIILSGCRCAAHNAKIGGAKHSYHMAGKACDFQIQGVSPSIIAECLEDIYSGMYGIIRYSNFVHFDVRDGFYRRSK